MYKFAQYDQIVQSVKCQSYAHNNPRIVIVEPHEFYKQLATVMNLPPIESLNDTEQVVKWSKSDRLKHHHIRVYEMINIRMLDAYAYMITENYGETMTEIYIEGGIVRDVEVQFHGTIPAIGHRVTLLLANMEGYTHDNIHIRVVDRAIEMSHIIPYRRFKIEYLQEV